MLFLDIQTAKQKEMERFLPEVSAPSNYKDGKKISEYIQKRTQEMRAGMALDPDYGRIIAIGYAQSEKDRPEVMPYCESEFENNFKTEASMLTAFWDLFAKHSGHVCGYNVFGFDLPYIMRRTLANRIKIHAPVPELKKYQTRPVCDLMGIMYNWNLCWFIMA